MALIPYLRQEESLNPTRLQTRPFVGGAGRTASPTIFRGRSYAPTASGYTAIAEGLMGIGQAIQVNRARRDQQILDQLGPVISDIETDYLVELSRKRHGGSFSEKRFLEGLEDQLDKIKGTEGLSADGRAAAQEARDKLFNKMRVAAADLAALKADQYRQNIESANMLRTKRLFH